MAAERSAGDDPVREAASAEAPGRPATVRLVAGGLLLFAVAVYIPARLYETVHPAVGYLRAFAEAAMVGGLADWFAVTALFRHPLGVPIPHTAVIQRHKDRIGAALGRFIERNFLSAEAISARLAEIDFAAHVAEWLEAEENRAAASERLAGLLVPALDAVDDEEVGRFIHGRLAHHVRDRIDVGPLLAELIAALAADRRHQRLVDELVVHAAALLEDSEPLIRERITARTAWLWRKLSVDEHVASQILGAAQETIHELGEDPEHPWRLRLDQVVEDFIESLRTSPRYREEGERLIGRLLRHPAVEKGLIGLWTEFKRHARDEVETPGSPLRTALSSWLAKTGDSLLDDDAMRARFNHWLRERLVSLAASRGHEVSRLVTDTVRGWDPATMAQRIERQVGDDLQYIRINGTVIGGLAGLVIHALSQLLV